MSQIYKTSSSSPPPPPADFDSFLAYLGTTDTDVIGDATVFQIGSGNPLTIVSNVGGLITTGGLITVGSPGSYNFSCTVYVLGDPLSGITNGTLTLVTTSQSYSFPVCSSGAFMGAVTVAVTGTVTALMSATDTAYWTIQTTDGGGKVDDVAGSGSPYSTFISGFGPI